MCFSTIEHRIKDLHNLGMRPWPKNPCLSPGDLGTTRGRFPPVPKMLEFVGDVPKMGRHLPQPWGTSIRPEDGGMDGTSPIRPGDGWTSPMAGVS